MTQSVIQADQIVRDVVRHHPRGLEIMEQMGINHCCGAQLTLAEAAAAAGVPLDVLLAALRRAAGDEVPETLEVHLDVRDDIRLGEEPFARIMSTVKQLTPSQVLVLRAPFEPVPLYAALGKKGYAHRTERRAADDWCVSFYRAGVAELSGQGASPISGQADRPLVIDVRGLEPPGPMVRILEAIERLNTGEIIEVLHERRPLFLYPQLDERGFVHETDEPEAGVVRIRIRRRNES